MNNFTFCALDLNLDENTRKQMLNEVLSCNELYWYHDTFRGCGILPLFNGDGTIGAPREGIIRSQGDMIFTEAGEQCPTIKKFVINNVFPFMDIPGRMSILKTDSNKTLNVHMDSSRRALGTIQHKFRIVLNGEIGKLYFLDSELNKVFVPEYWNTYVLDGTHPHSIEADTEEKITICIGTPWTGNYTEHYNKLIEKSPYKMKVNQPEFREEWECK